MAMHARTLLGICILAGSFGISSCSSPELENTGEIYLDLPAVKYNYNNFIQLEDSLNAKATLGRVLFYDRQMSLNNSVACASCHKQEFAFSDNRRFSSGFESRLTTRNSMPLQNITTSNFMVFDFALTNTEFSPNSGLEPTRLFWDGRESDINKLILQPVGNHIEMGITDINELTKKLSTMPYYAPLFTEAYGSPTINAGRISSAVTAFITSITTFNTRLDKYNNQKFINTANNTTNPDAANVLTSLEIEGMNLFNDKYDCNSCHQVQNPNGYQFAGTFANVGLDMTYSDPGLETVTKESADNGKFKIPSLRNVSFTAPYMHDGRFATLDEVVEHYSEGMADNPNLDSRLAGTDGHARSMTITEHEKQAIIAFLHTLDDESVLKDPKFSNPFKVK